MAGYKCPFCQHFIAVDGSTASERNISFSRDDDFLPGRNILMLTFVHCPNCERYVIKAKSTYASKDKFIVDINPSYVYTSYPDYIPQPIRSDYEEACAISNLSPKACATLCRRCLQGMIRDFWGIRKDRLADEIFALKDRIPPTQWQVIDAVRQIGNIGAHMEKDVNLIIDIESDEAEKLILLIERLMQSWYIEREAERQLFDGIMTIKEESQAKRKAK